MLTKPGWKPVTTELKDRWIGREYWFQVISRAFDVPVDDIRPWSFANAEAEYKELQAHMRELMKRQEDLLLPIMGNGTGTPMGILDHAGIKFSGPPEPPCIGNDPACPCQDGLACHYKDYPADGDYPAVKGWPVINGRCDVCKGPITPGQRYSHHVRLNVDVHHACPHDNVRGEDITVHCMRHGVWGQS